MEANRQPPINYIARITATYEALGYDHYQWRETISPPVFAKRVKSVSESKIGMIATGGVYSSGQIAFHYRDDATYRAIPSSIEASELRATHFAYDLTGARQDINVVFPIEAMRALEKEGRVGSLAENFLTCMGGIYSQRRVEEELAPKLVERYLAEEVDAVLLVPV